MSEKAQGPEEMCLSLEHQTRRKPLKKWVILIADRVTVGTSYMIPIVYRYIDSYTALFLLLVYRGTWRA